MNRRRTSRNSTTGCQCVIVSSDARGRRTRGSAALAPGFSLTELLVVLAVAILLTGLLLPALAGIRENAHRIICASNERQQGMLLLLFASDNDEELPYADPLRWDSTMPQELMAAHHGGKQRVNQYHNWDGLGLLFQEGYCDSCDVFYCPSHHGDHPQERYAHHWSAPDAHFAPVFEPVYMNYHYAGDLEWESGLPRNLNEGNRLVLATDGLRTLRDFNHRVGMNVLRGDGSVKWEDNAANVVDLLPQEEIDDPSEMGSYNSLWSIIMDMMR